MALNCAPVSFGDSGHIKEEPCKLYFVEFGKEVLYFPLAFMMDRPVSRMRYGTYALAFTNKPSLLCANTLVT